MHLDTIVDADTYDLEVEGPVSDYKLPDKLIVSSYLEYAIAL